MARGQQKIQSQQKAAEKAAKLKKMQGQTLKDSKNAAAAGLKASCSVCKVNKNLYELTHENVKKFALLYGIRIVTNRVLLAT